MIKYYIKLKLFRENIMKNFVIEEKRKKIVNRFHQKVSTEEILSMLSIEEDIEEVIKYNYSFDEYTGEEIIF